jgi:hypothetical protein
MARRQLFRLRHAFALQPTHGLRRSDKRHSCSDQGAKRLRQPWPRPTSGAAPLEGGAVPALANSDKYRGAWALGWAQVTFSERRYSAETAAPGLVLNHSRD